MRVLPVNKESDNVYVTIIMTITKPVLARTGHWPGNDLTIEIFVAGSGTIKEILKILPGRQSDERGIHNMNLYNCYCLIFQK